MNDNTKPGPRFVTLDEMFGASMANDGLAGHALSAKLGVEPIDLEVPIPSRQADEGFYIPSVRQGVASVFAQSGAPPLGFGEKLYQYMDELGLDLDAFDRVFSDHGYTGADLNRRDVWEEDDFYPAIAKAFVAASADYVYAPDRRPDTVSIDIRREIRKIAAEFRSEAARKEVLH